MQEDTQEQEKRPDPQTPDDDNAHKEKVDEVAKRVFEKYRKAFEELAK